LIGNRLVATDLVVPCGDVTQDTLRRPDGTGGHPAARQQLVAANILEHGGRILVGHGSKAGCPIAAENITLAGNKGSDLAQRMGRQGRQRAEAMYDERDVLDREVQVYRKLIKQRLHQDAFTDSPAKTAHSDGKQSGTAPPNVAPGNRTGN
jgi:hypothetical protein